MDGIKYMIQYILQVYHSLNRLINKGWKHISKKEYI